MMQSGYKVPVNAKASTYSEISAHDDKQADCDQHKMACEDAAFGSE
jgi:hypothetical protein